MSNFDFSLTMIPQYLAEHFLRGFQVDISYFWVISGARHADGRS